MTSQRREEAIAALRERIAEGEIKPGARIGQNLPAIAAEYGVGRNTMQSILVELAGEGIVRREHGIAYFAANDAVAIIAAGQDGGKVEAAVRKLQEDVEGLKADVDMLKTRRNIPRAPRKQERSDEQSG